MQNNTPWDFQLMIRVGDEFLEGEWRSIAPQFYQYQIVEKNHRIVAEYWGGYTRCNQLFRRTIDCNGIMIQDELVAANDVIMMYAPFLAE